MVSRSVDCYGEKLIRCSVIRESARVRLCRGVIGRELTPISACTCLVKPISLGGRFSNSIHHSIQSPPIRSPLLQSSQSPNPTLLHPATVLASSISTTRSAPPPTLTLLSLAIHPMQIDLSRRSTHPRHFNYLRLLGNG